jgi:hypothetical protein
MKRPLYLRSLAAATIVASLGSSGCGALFDMTYALGDKRYNESKEERKPTGQVISGIEYEGTVGTDGEIRLSCTDQERRIERTFSVNKTYQYRGGYKRSMYVSSAILSTVVGGAIAGIVAIGCTLPPQPGEKDPKRWSCLNALFATPFALDLGYSLVRVGMAKTPKLVDKTKNEGQLALAEVPAKSTSTTCDSVDRVVLGSVYGASEFDAINSGSSEGPKLAEGSLPVMRNETGGIKLISQPDVIHAWVLNSNLGLWVINREGKPRALKVDRCGALRPTVMAMQPADQPFFHGQCPLPNPAVPR